MGCGSHGQELEWSLSQRSQALARRHGSAGVQGVRARSRRHKGCYYEGACEAEMSTPAASGKSPIMQCVWVSLSYSGPYYAYAPYSIYNHG